LERNINKLRRWCIRRKLDGWNVTTICRHAKIRRSTFYFWWNKYQEGGLENLQPKSRRPKKIRKTPNEIIDRIIEIRKKDHPNEKVITSLLQREGIEIGHTTVYKILDDAGLINSLPKPRKKRTYKSWSRKSPNSLWQTDLCIYGNKWLSSFLDDHSRFLVGTELFNSGYASNIVNQFEFLIQEFGKPREVITDHGTQYYSVRSGTSLFDGFCTENGIKHILGGIGKPTTLGKIERFHRTFRAMYPRFKNLENFRSYYNCRPHAGIGYKTPEELYFRKVSNMS